MSRKEYLTYHTQLERELAREADQDASASLVQALAMLEHYWDGQDDIPDNTEEVW